MKLITGVYSKRIFRLVRKACLIAGIFLSNVSGYLIADTLHLHNGNSVSGKILEEVDGVELTFRYQHHGKEITRRVPLEQIMKVEKEVVAPEEIDDTDDVKPLVESMLPPKSDNEVVVLHLRGAFDTPRLSTVGEVITYGEFEMMMEVARSRNPKAIVLSIDSPGGLVSTCNQIIDSLIESQTSPQDERVVAWVELGGSAAALAALACKEIVMRPNGRMGSATTVFSNGEAVPEAETAMEQKVKAMENARVRQVSNLTGRPIEIQIAMQEPEHEFWFHSADGFSLEEPDKLVRSEWRSFDTDENQPLALSAHELELLGISEGTTGSESGLLEILGLDPKTKIVDIDLMDQQLQKLLAPAREKMVERWVDYRKERGRFEKRLFRFFDDCWTAMTAVGQINDGYWRIELYQVQRAINKLYVPAITPTLKEKMQHNEPRRLALYQVGIQFAKGHVKMAKADIKRSSNMRSTPTAVISKHVSNAWGYALQGYVGREYHIPKVVKADDEE